MTATHQQLDTRPAALALLDRLLDPGSHRSWDQPPAGAAGSARYAEQLAAARLRSGVDEAVLTGEGRIDGRRLALAVGEFGFLAGSVGQDATRRLVAAIHRATRERLPLFAAPVSGGTRMQEGTAAFVGMTAIATALTEHRAAGLPYLVHLRHPCTGGALASWGSLGQITTAEPDALIGFLGPRVFHALHDEPFPPGVQTAENLHRVGILDAVLTPDRLRDRLSRTLALLAPQDPDRTSPAPHRPSPADPPHKAPNGTDDSRAGETGAADTDMAPTATGSTWNSVLRTRQPTWPGVRDLLDAAVDFVELRGTGEGERDDAVVIGIARFQDRSCVVVGHDRSAPRPVGPAGLRTVRRGIKLAAEWRLPLLTVVDTAGAELSPSAEEGALAGEIARCLADLSALRVPRISLLLGQGTGGAALALFVADRTVAAEHAWLAPLPPEGASAILYRDTGQAPRLAVEQGISATELYRRGLVHRLVPDGRGLAARLAGVVAGELRGL
ncbi:carboxyl transferase domain-containing protein [Streptomyces sp. NPDC002523]